MKSTPEEAFSHRDAPWAIALITLLCWEPNAVLTQYVRFCAWDADQRSSVPYTVFTTSSLLLLFSSSVLTMRS